MNAIDYSQLESIMVDVDDINTESDIVGQSSQGDGDFQERLGKHFHSVQQHLDSSLNAALEMVKGRLKSVRLQDEEMGQLRREKQQLAAELASLHGATKGNSTKANNSTKSFLDDASEGHLTGSPCNSDDVDAAMPEASKAWDSSGGSIVLVGPGAKSTLCEEFVDTTAGSSRPDMASLDSVVPVDLGATERPLSRGGVGWEAPLLPSIIVADVEDGAKEKQGVRFGDPDAKGKPAQATLVVKAKGLSFSPSTFSSESSKSCDSQNGRDSQDSTPAAQQSKQGGVKIMVQPGLADKPGAAAVKARVSLCVPSGGVSFAENWASQGSAMDDEEAAEPKQRVGMGRKSLSQGTLGIEDASSFAMLHVWTAQKDEAVDKGAGDKVGRMHRKMSMMMFDSSSLAGELMTLRGDDDDVNYLFWLVANMMIHPSASYRVAWDISSFVLLAYDMMTLPVFSAFNPAVNPFIQFMIWTTRLFWTLDICASILTGYMKSDGVVEMRPLEILKRYAKTWMVLDFMLVGIDWVEMFASLDSSLDIARLGKASRGFRILRLMRLLRMIRFGQFVQMLDERIRSDRLMIFADIIKIVILILLFSHFAACCWYGIGTSSDGPNWVQMHIENDKPDASLAVRYTLALHWSLAQFAGGTDEVLPHNLGERLYALVLFLVAFMLGAVVVSSLTSEICRLQNISNTNGQQMSIMRRFLADNNVATKLAIRIQRNAKHALQERQRNIPENDVELLRLVSDPLRIELHFEIQSPLLSKHPFFFQYIEECPHIMRKVCHKCTKTTACFAGDVVFSPGEAPRPPKMYFVTNGTFEYFLMSGNKVVVRSGSWLSEPVIWTTWTHKGGLRAKGDSHLCELLASDFQQVCVEFDHTSFDPRTYGMKFLTLMNTFEGNVSDLPMRQDQLEEAANFNRSPSVKMGGSRSGSAHRQGSALLPRRSGARVVRWT